MAIASRDLPVGTTLRARYKGRTYHLTVIDIGGGRRRFRLQDGRDFRSPSGAGRAVMGGIACNGWRFWSHAEATDATSGDTTADTAIIRNTPRPRPDPPPTGDVRRPRRHGR